MSIQEVGTAEIISAAYDQAWHEFTASSNVMLDEKRSGPFKIRWYIYISLMVATGERDPNKIARAALRMIREYEQIARSKARLKSIRNLFRCLSHVASESHMDNTTLLIILIVLLVLGGGWYGRGRWY